MLPSKLLTPFATMPLTLLCCAEATRRHSRRLGMLETYGARVRCSPLSTSHAPLATNCASPRVQSSSLSTSHDPFATNCASPCVRCPFQQKVNLEDAIGPTPLLRLKRAGVWPHWANGIPLGCPLLVRVPVHTVICVQTLKVP
jgi:hypothetical protein